VWPRRCSWATRRAVRVAVALLVPGHAEIVIGLVPLEHVVGADQHRMRDRDRRPFLIAARGDPRILCAKVGVFGPGH
jgi:hypothetical protein